MTPASEKKLTLPQLFLARAKSYSGRTALLFKDPSTKTYQPISWDQWTESVRNFALGLHSLDLKAGAKMAIVSENRPEWTYADLGALSLGAVVVPVYPTSSPEDVAYILQNAEVEILVVSTQEQLERLWDMVKTIPAVRWVICLDTFSRRDAKLLSLEDLFRLGQVHSAPEQFLQTIHEGKPEDLATLIYTSGTTGPPKGVMLTHANFIENYLGARERIKLSDKDVALSFLPLSHIFERLAGYYFMSFHGAVIAYAENMQTVSEDIMAVRPTVCAAVPRFYEKVYARILERVENGPRLKRAIFYWAVNVGRRRSRAIFSKTQLSWMVQVQYALAKALVFKQICAKMGGRIRFFISGGAPLSKELAEFFFAADVLILEGYGLTETSPVIAVNSPDDFCFGTVGKVLSNVEVKIADDGEILTKGPCVMAGYYRNPEATAEAIQNGWFHTGDIGTIENGYLKITDRKKDIIATSGGKKISPQNIEQKILADSLFLQAVIVGDKKNYLVALVVPNRTVVEQYAAQNNLQKNYSELLKDPSVMEWINTRFHQRTQGLASYEQIKYIALLEKEFSQDSGELTPTLKYKRRFIMQKYQTIIDSLYSKKPDTAA